MKIEAYCTSRHFKQTPFHVILVAMNKCLDSNLRHTQLVQLCCEPLLNLGKQIVTIMEKNVFVALTPIYF